MPTCSCGTIVAIGGACGCTTCPNCHSKLYCDVGKMSPILQLNVLEMQELTPEDWQQILASIKSAKYAAYYDPNPDSDFTYSRLASLVEKVENYLKRNKV